MADPPKSLSAPAGPLPGFRLVGADGNAFAILGRFRRCARDAGWPRLDIDAVCEQAKAADYGHLLRTFIPYEDTNGDDD